MCCIEEKKWPFQRWKRDIQLGDPQFGQGLNAINRHDACFAWVGQNHFKPASETNYHLIIYIYTPRTQLTSTFGGQPPKTRSFPINTRVIWVRGIYIYVNPLDEVDCSVCGAPGDQLGMSFFWDKCSIIELFSSLAGTVMVMKLIDVVGLSGWIFATKNTYESNPCWRNWRISRWEIFAKVKV